MMNPYPDYHSTLIAKLKPTVSTVVLIKNVWGITSLPDESSLWTLLGHQKRPKFDFVTHHTNQATQNDQTSHKLEVKTSFRKY